MRFREYQKTDENEERELENFEMKYQQFRLEMKSAVGRYFPNESHDFVEPSLERQYRKFVEIINPVAAGSVGREKDFLKTLSDVQMSALMGEAAIRYLDDFIDNSLWPHISNYQETELRAKFREFCNEALGIIKKYAPSYPNEIIELWLLELDLQLAPSQESFDAKIISLFNRKSLNMSYVESLMRNEVPGPDFTAEQENHLSYQALCIRDFARDFELGNYRNETDFNLRNYLTLHNFRPTVLLLHLRRVEDQLMQCEGSQSYSKYQIQIDLKACRKVITELERFE